MRIKKLEIIIEKTKLIANSKNFNNRLVGVTLTTNVHEM